MSAVQAQSEPENLLQQLQQPQQKENENVTLMEQYTALKEQLETTQARLKYYDDMPFFHKSDTLHIVKSRVRRAEPELFPEELEMVTCEFSAKINDMCFHLEDSNKIRLKNLRETHFSPKLEHIVQLVMVGNPDLACLDDPEIASYFLGALTLAAVLEWTLPWKSEEQLRHEEELLQEQRVLRDFGMSTLLRTGFLRFDAEHYIRCRRSRTSNLYSTQTSNSDQNST